MGSSYAAVYNDPPKLASNKPIKITSDKLKILRNNQTIVFEGGVIAIQGDMKLLSDKMIIYYIERKKLSEDSPRRLNNISRINVEDNVKVLRGNLLVSGDEGYYDIGKGILEINGNVVMNEDGSEVQGGRFIYDVNAMESTIIGDLNKKEYGDDGRVTITLDEKIEKDVMKSNKKNEEDEEEVETEVKKEKNQEIIVQ